MEINEYLTKWSEKTGIGVGELKEDFDRLLDEEKKQHSDWKQEDLELRATQRLALSLKKILKSPAVGFEGIIIAVSDGIDTVARIRREAIQKFNENPTLAVQQGITDDEGQPLDTRTEWSTGRPNPNYGKPLPQHNWMRRIYGIAVKAKDEKPKFFQLNLSGKLAETDEYPMFEFVKFRAIDRSEENSNTYNLNQSSFTTFTPTANISLTIEDAIKTYCKDLLCDVKDLLKYHTDNKEDYNRLVVVKADVSNINLEPTAFGSRVMNVCDINNIDIESSDVTCWVPQRCDIDFAEQSKVIIVGRTTQGFKRDEQGNTTEELGDVMINVYGLYALPKYKISPQEVKPITEENISDESEDEEVDEANENW